MSADLYWSLEPKENIINCSPDVRDAVIKIFGNKLEETDLNILQAMREASGDKVYDELIELVLKYKIIMLKVRY